MSGQIVVYWHLDGHFTVSEDGVWLPGIYETEQAARYAVGLSDEVLKRLQRAVNEREPDFAKRYLTLEMLMGVPQ